LPSNTVLGGILDVGCGTCQLFKYLRGKGWKGDYTGVDVEKYKGYKYPEGIKLIIGDALEIKFPQVDTCILYNILEHVDSPVALLSKSLKVSKNALVNVENQERSKLGTQSFYA